MFKIGDFAVYPAHGVGVVEGIEEKEIGNTVYSFFVLRIVETDYTILVPTSNAEKVGLRPLSNPTVVRQVWRILRDKKVAADGQTWNRRQREYNDRIRTGCLKQLASVLRDLYVIGRGKDLSYGERKMFEQARTLLVGELAAAANTTPQTVLGKIEQIYE